MKVVLLQDVKNGVSTSRSRRRLCQELILLPAALWLPVEP